MTTQTIREKIELIVDETRNKTLKELNAIKHVGIDYDRNVVVLIIGIGALGGQGEKNLRLALAKVIKLELGFKGVKIQFEEEQKVINQKTKFIIVASGKGGVGKSMVTANLAYALKRQNKKVAILDADIYGASIPNILEMTREEPQFDDFGYIEPLKSYGIEVMSTHFFTSVDSPVIARGVLIKDMLHNYFHQVKWDKNIEFFLIDSPPGTGDALSDLKTLIPSSEVLLVTTPHALSAAAAIQAGKAFQGQYQNIIGVVENMAYYDNPKTKKKEYLFGQGGGDEVSNTLDCELLATIPINPPKSHFALYESNEEIGQIFDDLATLLIIR